MTDEAIIEVLENRKAILKNNIDEDKKRYNDPFLSQHMRGRVSVEENWLAETERLIEAIRKGL
jgi:hypothetical protein